jgi:hydroxylysine kinase
VSERSALDSVGVCGDEDRFPMSDLKKVVRAVEQVYSVRPRDLKVYKGEFDRNIRFDDPDRGTWLIKVSTADVGMTSIRWQASLLEAAEADQRIPFLTPNLLTSADGRTHITVEGDKGTYIARVVRWIDGSLMSDEVFSGLDLPYSLGAASAHLTRALGGLAEPVGITGHRWLIHRGPEVVEESLRGLPDDGRTCVVAEISRRFGATVLPRLDNLPWSIIHHDLHDGNIVVDAVGSSVVGVIDFNDAAFAPRVADLAIAGAYAMLRQAEPERVFRAVVDGYRTILDLSSAELDVVGEMALMRLCMNWAQWQSRAQAARDNEYALSRSRYTWPLIEHLAEVGPPKV